MIITGAIGNTINNHISFMYFIKRVKWTIWGVICWLSHLHFAKFFIVLNDDRKLKLLPHLKFLKIVHVWLGNLKNKIKNYWRHCRVTREYFGSIRDLCTLSTYIHLDQYSLVCLLQIFLSIEILHERGTNFKRHVMNCSSFFLTVAHL